MALSQWTSKEKRAQLGRRVWVHTMPQRMARPCWVVLLAAEGVLNRHIAPEVGMIENHVSVCDVGSRGSGWLGWRAGPAWAGPAWAVPGGWAPMGCTIVPAGPAGGACLTVRPVHPSRHRHRIPGQDAARLRLAPDIHTRVGSWLM